VDGGSPELLRIEVLGPLRAWRGGTPLDLVPLKRQGVLAALLLREGAVVRHDQLLDSVWGPEPPAGGRKVLPTHVNSLRRALDSAGTPPAESVIRSGKGWYRFAVERVRLDTADLGERSDAVTPTIASGDPATAADQLSAAIGLFRGEPLANLPGPFAQESRASRPAYRWTTPRTRPTGVATHVPEPGGPSHPFRPGGGSSNRASSALVGASKSSAYGSSISRVIRAVPDAPSA